LGSSQEGQLTVGPAGIGADVGGSSGRPHLPQKEAPGVFLKLQLEQI